MAKEWLMKLILTNEQIALIVSELRGTAGDLDKEIEAIAGEGITAVNLSNETLTEIDDRVFLCEVCGWWCDADERSDGNVCENCYDDDDAEEEDEEDEDREES
jgi:hypothetical protein